MTAAQIQKKLCHILDKVKVDAKNIRCYLNKGEEWNSAYAAEWVEVVIPVRIPEYEIPTKKLMEGEGQNIFEFHRFDHLRDTIKVVLADLLKLKVDQTFVAVRNGKVCLCYTVE